MKFVKMHGCGNDYIYLDAFTAPEIERLIDRPDWVGLVGRMSDRHKGIGSDGVILVCRPKDSIRSGGLNFQRRSSTRISKRLLGLRGICCFTQLTAIKMC